MKLTLVAICDNRRVICWRAVFIEGLIIIALSLFGYILAHQAFGMLGGASPLFPGVMFAVMMPLGCVLGMHFRRAWKLPLDKHS